MSWNPFLSVQGEQTEIHNIMVTDMFCEEIILRHFNLNRHILQ